MYICMYELLFLGMATFGFGKAALAVFLIESFRTINYRRYTRRQKMVELYYQEYKDELPHIGGYTFVTTRPY